MLKLALPCLTALGLMVGATLAQADDVTDAINEALTAYNEGDLSYAKESLDFAAQLVGQQKAETLATLFPEPLDGWDASAPQMESVGAAMFGGGTTATRDYQRDNASITITYTADSPMLAQLGAMFANPAIIGASGGKMFRIGRQTAMIDEDGAVQFLVDNRILVQIEGNAPEEDSVAYAKAIPIRQLKEY